MWKRLSDADISKAVEEEVRRRRSWRWPVLTAVLIAAALATLWSFGFRCGYISSGVILSGPATRLADPSTLGIFTIAFGLVLYQSRRKMLRNGQGLFGGLRLSSATVARKQRPRVLPRHANAVAVGIDDH
jgi:hypothetical protein